MSRILIQHDGDPSDLGSSLSNAYDNRPVCHLCQEDLARRWRISPRTLERWRWLHQGPSFLKVGGRVVYRLADVLFYETEQLHASGDASNPFFQRSR